MKLLPEGIGKFTEIIDNDLYFVDKTRFIKTLDESGEDFLFFVRPRRFGKSIFLNMLETYYDIARKDQFEHYFGKTWIYRHATPDHGKYLVINLDFSKVSGTTDSMASNFDAIIGMDIEVYAEKYSSFFKEDFLDKISKLDSAKNKLHYFCLQASLRKYPVYLMIDEYDNIVNEILRAKEESGDHDISRDIRFYIDFFKVVKSSCQKVFMTGVFPVTLDDLTSGYNIGTHISLTPLFNSMLGFTTAEVREIIAYYQENGLLSGFDPEKIISEMAVWYGGYSFSEDAFGKGDHVFNSYMVASYLSRFAMNGEPPEDKLVQNAFISYDNIKFLVNQGQHSANDNETREREAVIENLIAGEEYDRIIARCFSPEALLKGRNYISCLFYLGLLAVRGIKGVSPILGIPNLHARMQYYGYLQNRVKRALAEAVRSILAEAFDEAGFSGSIKTLVDVILDYYNRFSATRQTKPRDELSQALFQAFMSWTNMYDKAFEYELNQRMQRYLSFPENRFCRRRAQLSH
ncbi:MAG: AAA family ATPase [Succinimonas sp.]|nr:AAA family ATPase [Succinimonas sp.]